MYPVSAAQIRAARGLLQWTQDELAATAGVPRKAVQAVEGGDHVRTIRINAIYRTLCEHGIEFLEGDGVRRLPDGYREFVGHDCCDRFFEYVLKAIQEKGGNLICIIDHQDILTKKTCSTEHSNIERLQKVHDAADVKCIISDKLTLPTIIPAFQMRALPEEPGILPTCSFAYGDELAIAFYNNKRYLVYAVFRQIHFRQNFQNYFAPRWQVAKPLLIMPPVERKTQREVAYA